VSEDLVEALMRASRALVGIAAASVADEQLVTLVQYRALVVIAGAPQCRVNDLAQALTVHPTTATRLLDRLVSKELVRRSGAPGDRRVASLTLTSRGAAIVRRVQARRRAAIERVVGHMGASSSAVVVGALRDFADAAGERSSVDQFGWALHRG
jgi:DNA-binding MarR family transcriptional regulator